MLLRATYFPDCCCDLDHGHSDPKARNTLSRASLLQHKQAGRAEGWELRIALAPAMFIGTGNSLKDLALQKAGRTSEQVSVLLQLHLIN